MSMLVKSLHNATSSMVARPMAAPVWLIAYGMGSTELQGAAQAHSNQGVNKERVVVTEAEQTMAAGRGKRTAAHEAPYRMVRLLQ